MLGPAADANSTMAAPPRPMRSSAPSRQPTRPGGPASTAPRPRRLNGAEWPVLGPVGERSAFGLDVAQWVTRLARSLISWSRSARGVYQADRARPSRWRVACGWRSCRRAPAGMSSPERHRLSPDQDPGRTGPALCRWMRFLATAVPRFQVITQFLPATPPPQGGNGVVLY